MLLYPFVAIHVKNVSIYHVLMKDQWKREISREKHKHKTSAAVRNKLAN